MYFVADEGPGFLTTERLGRTQELTPAGFLLCRDVPVARLGEMLYTADDLPFLVPGRDGLIRVTVTDQCLFHPDTLASFNGMAITNGHPSELADPHNWQRYSKGTMLNPRRGEGANSDKLVADLLVMDAAAIKDVMAGKREVSLGYDADYEQSEPGRAIRTKMVGNHIALTDRGRCGPVCAIGDEAMGKQTSLKAMILGAFKTKDEAGLMKALDEMGDDPSQLQSGPSHHVVVNVAGQKEDGADPMKEMKDALTAHEARICALEGKKPTGDEDPAAAAAAKKKADEEKAAKDAETAAAAAEKEKADKAAADAAGAEKKEDDEPLKFEKDSTDPEGEAAGLGNRNVEGKVQPDNSKKTTDEASLTAMIQDTKARAEVLAPGVKYPAFDSKGGAATFDSLCSFRRKVLAHAVAKDSSLVPAGVDLKGMTCDAIGIAFHFASDSVMTKNNLSSITNRTTDSFAAKTTNKIDEINKMNADFWNSKKK